MNALMNITVRIQAANAQREIQALEAEIKTLRAQMGMVGASASSMIPGSAFSTMSRWGSQMQWAGRQLMTNFTVPLAAAGYGVTKWVLDNESAMVRLQKVYGDAATGPAKYAADLNGLGQAFDLLSVKYAQSRADVANIAADWAAAGATGGALARGVEATLKTMVLGEMDAASATEALIAIQAQYGVTTSGLMDIINTLNATENTTGVTFQGLVDGMSRSASAARSAGVDVDHLAAMIAAISPAAGSAGQAGNALKTIFSRMLGPTGEARDIMQAMGINIDDVSWSSLNGAQRLEVLANAYMKLDGAGQGMISSQAGIVSAVVASRWQINRFDVLMRDLAYHIDGNSATNGYYTKTLELLADKTAVFKLAQSELNTVLESSPYAVKRAGIVIQNSLMKVVTALLPQILYLVNSVATLAQKFANLDPGLQKAIIGFLGFLAILGPPLVVLGSLAVAVGRIGLLMQSLASPFTLVAALFKKNEAGASKFGIALSGMVGKVRTTFSSLVPTIMSSAPATASAAAQAGAATGEAYVSGYRITTIGRLRKWQADTILSFYSMGTGISTSFAAMRSKTEAYWRLMSTDAGIAYNRIAAASAAGWGRVASVTTAGATAVAGATRAGWTAAKAETATAMTLLPGTVTRGMERANYEVQRVMFTVMPAAFSSGWTRINAAVAGAHLSLNRATERTMMENLTVINGYVNGAIAAAARGGAGIATAAQAGSAAVMARVGGGGAAAAAGGVASAGFAARFMGGLKGIPAAIGRFFVGIGPKIMTGLGAIIPYISRFGLQLLKFFTGPWGLAITAVVTLLYMFRDQIGQVFSNIGRMAQDATNPFGQAWAGVVNLFNKGVTAVQKGMQSLPAGIRGALQAVINLVGTAAQKVYQLFSYMNPFAHHSPSLVENVTNGMAVVGAQFGLAADTIKTHMMNAYASLQRFGGATANFLGQLDAIKKANDRATVVANAGGDAGAAYDNLIAALVPLKADLDAVSSAMDAQQAVVTRLQGALDAAKRTASDAQQSFDALSKTADGLSTALSAAQTELSRYADMPIQGQRDMNDAIFANEMAQKKLNLAMLQMTDVPVDTLKNQLASLAGEIESLRGTQADLRASGAGSDILGVYQDQINALDAQQTVIKNSVAPINDMQKQLEDLQKAGQILDLQNSINFDPLIRQVDQLATTYQEMPFDQIIAGVNAQKAKVADLQAQYDSASAAVDRQKVALDAANTEVERAQVAYDAQAASLDGLKTVYDATVQQINDIETAIQNVISAADEMKSALDAANGGGAGNQSPALQNFNGAAGGGFADVGGSATIGAETGDIQKWLDEFVAGTGTMFDGIDIFGPIRKMWGNLQGWWSANVTPIFSNLGQGILDIFNGIDWGAPFRGIGSWFDDDSTVGNALSDWWSRVSEPLSKAWDNIKKSWDEAMTTLKPAIDKLGGAFTDLQPVLQELWKNAKPVLDGLGIALKVVAAIVAGVVASAFIIFANIVERVVMPVFRAIVGVIGGVIQVLTGVINFIVGVFTLNWSQAWLGIKQIFGGIWDAIYAVLEGAVGVVIGLFMGLVNGVIDAAKWLWDVLVGHSIIPDLINAIIAWFQSLPGAVMAFVMNLVNGAIQWFTDMKDKLVAKVVELWNGVTSWFSNLKDTVVNKVGDLIGGVVDWFTGLPAKAINAISSLVGSLTSKGGEMIQGLKDGASTVWTNVTGWLGDRGSAAVSAIGNTLGTLSQKGQDLLSGLWDGAKSTWMEIGTWAAGRGGALLSSLGNLGETLKNAGKSIMDGFFTGLKNTWNDIKDWVSGLGKWIADHKGPRSYDQALLVPAGGWIMGGLAKGLENGIPGLENTLGSVTDSILANIAAVPTAAVKSLLATSATVGTGASATQGASATMYAGTNDNVQYNFYGNLEFPNIKSGDDAQVFIDNLGTLAGGSGR